MTGFALALVLGSAVMHATWNLVAKRVQAETPFLFLVYVVGALAHTPFAVAVIVIAPPRLGLPALVFIAMAIVLQTVYFATLTAGYRVGDLSLVYPIARATGPLLATVGAIAILGERPSPLAIAGALAIVLGALVRGRRWSAEPPLVPLHADRARDQPGTPLRVPDVRDLPRRRHAIGATTSA